MAHRSDGRGRGIRWRRPARRRGAASAIAVSTIAVSTIAVSAIGLGGLLFGLGLAVAAGSARADEDPSHSVAELWTYGAKQNRAIEVEPDIFAVNGTSNAYLISTVEGSVLVDTGGNNDAAR